MDMSPDQVYMLLLVALGLIYFMMKLVGRKYKSVDRAAEDIANLFMIGISKGETIKSALTTGSKPLTKTEANVEAKKEAVSYIEEAVKRKPGLLNAAKKMGLDIAKTSIGNILEDMLHGSKKFSGFNPGGFIKSLVC